MLGASATQWGATALLLLIVGSGARYLIADTLKLFVHPDPGVDPTLRRIGRGAALLAWAFVTFCVVMIAVS